MADYDAVEIPLVGRTETLRRYRSSELGKQSKAKYKHNNSKHVTDAAYLARQFVAWDGEGVTVDGEHRYVLLANSLGESYTDTNGIPFGDIAEWLLAVKHTHPAAINVGFALGYDFNCWLADLPQRDVEGIARRRSYTSRGYKMAWRHGKSFYIAPAGLKGESRKGKGQTVYDAFPFFQRSFVTACDEYLGTDWEGREEIMADKLRRATFTLDELPRIKEYNKLELRNLVRLMEELRLRLNRVTLRPARWDGPGAVATALMRREDIHAAKADSPAAVATAARHAYAGGRFEMLQWGVTGR